MKAFVANSSEHYKVKELVKKISNLDNNIQYVESQTYHSTYFQSIKTSDLYIGCIGKHFSYNYATIKMARNAVSEKVKEVVLLIPENSDYLDFIKQNNLDGLKQIKFKNEKELVDIVKEKIYSRIA